MTSTYLSRACGLSGLLITLILMASPSFAASQPGSLRYSVFVDKFENKSDAPREIGGDLASELTTALQESGHFIVVAQEDMQHSSLKEQARGESGVTKQGRKTAVRSQMTPAQLLVKGVITHYQQGAANQDGGFGFGGIKIKAGRKKTEVSGTLQMIDATTGTLVAAKNFTGIAQGRGLSLHYDGNGKGSDLNSGEDNNIHQALANAVNDVISWMVSKLPSVPWRGSVVKMANNEIIINRGSREGVMAGDDFVAGESEILRDPDTGEVLRFG